MYLKNRRFQICQYAVTVFSFYRFYSRAISFQFIAMLPDNTTFLFRSEMMDPCFTIAALNSQPDLARKSTNIYAFLWRLAIPICFSIAM